MHVGKQSWTFNSKPAIYSTAVVGGPFEKQSPLHQDFDYFFDQLRIGEQTFEKGHRMLMEKAIELALKKKNVQSEEIDFLFAGDLINQITPSNFAARSFQIPYLGIFSACATSMEAMALASLLVDSGNAHLVLAGATSHNAAVEKQFRYPTEYGGQKPPTAQWTVTGSGFALVGKSSGAMGPHVYITSATVGKVIDFGMTDPFNMGGAMAPAAVNTILRHHHDLNLKTDYYDAIFTGDLAEIGIQTALEWLKKKGFTIDKDRLMDCGMLIYENNSEVQSGGSGAGCSASVLFGHIFNEMHKGTWKRILVVATGALLSPLSFQQNETIPCIAHAVAFEYGI